MRKFTSDNNCTQHIFLSMSFLSLFGIGSERRILISIFSSPEQITSKYGFHLGYTCMKEVQHNIANNIQSNEIQNGRGFFYTHKAPGNVAQLKRCPGGYAGSLNVALQDGEFQI